MGFKNNKKKAEELNTRQIISLMGFRKPKDVIINRGKKATTLAICPTCHTPIDIEYSNYCTHCGQKLQWRKIYTYFYKTESIEYDIGEYFRSRNEWKEFKSEKRKIIKSMISNLRKIKRQL